MEAPWLHSVSFGQEVIVGTQIFKAVVMHLDSLAMSGHQLYLTQAFLGLQGAGKGGLCVSPTVTKAGLREGECSLGSA